MTTTPTVLSASNFSSSSLGATASTTSQLLQQTVTNPVNATTATALNIGGLVTNQTQLTTYGGVTSNNPTDYYNFNLTGTSIKGSFSNISDTTNLRYQLYNSAGTLIADNNGTAAQQTAFSQLTSAAGLTAASGQYTVKISYAPLSVKSLSQNYVFQLYSGSTFNTSYETTAQTQNSASQAIPATDGTWADAGAQLYTRSQYNQMDATLSSAINIGWLTQNKTALGVTSQLTDSDNTDYYQFDLNKGDNIKMAFNNVTNTSNLRVQLYDSSGLDLIADNQGTAAQKAAYAQLTSSTGLAKPVGNYVVKVSYAQGANQAKTQTYNFQLSSGTYYSTMDSTTASAQTVQNAILSGDYTPPSYNPQTAIASYLNGGNNDGILSILS